MHDKVAIVTGGASGIGAAIAENLAAAGAKVVVAGRNLAKAEAFADTLRAKGYQAEAGQVDVAHRQTTQDLVAGVIARHGAVPILVSSAGITRFTPFLETTEED